MSVADTDRRTAAGESARSQEPGPCSASARGCTRVGRLVEVEFLDGDDDTVVSGSPIQYVNLRRDAAFVHAGHAANMDRMSRKPRLRVRFDPPGTYTFKVRLLPSGSNISYTDSEKARNGNFLYEWRERQFSTNATGIRIVDNLELTAAGKSKYRVKAVDVQGNEVRSSEIQAKRLAFYVTFPMRTVQAARNLSAFRTEMRRHDIDMVGLERRSIRHMPNIGSDAENRQLKQLVRAQYEQSSAPDREPYVLAIVFTDQLAVKNPRRQFQSPTIDVGPASTNPYRCGIRSVGLRSGDGMADRYLWKNVVPGENWFRSVEFAPAGGGARIPVPEDKCTPVPVDASQPDKCKIVHVDVSWLPEGRGKLHLKFDVVDRMRGGLAAAGNLIILCTRAWWQAKSEESQVQTLIHEAGHQCGMVADGSNGPDRTPNQYDDRGHVGSHCHRGLSGSVLTSNRYGTIEALNQSTCVMFGSTNGRARFCSSCTPAVRKQDLSRGWSRF